MGRLVKPPEDEDEEVKLRKKLRGRNRGSEQAGQDWTILSTPGYIFHAIPIGIFLCLRERSGLFKDVLMKEYLEGSSSLQTDEEEATALSSSTNGVYNVFRYFGCGAKSEVERFSGDLRVEEDKAKYL